MPSGTSSDLWRLPDWERALGEPEISGVIRLRPEDFIVHEIPLIDPDGEGAHLWLEVEKRNANSNWVAGRIASAAGVHEREIGFAGMKDRHGVTSQWFSVSMQEASDSNWRNWEIPDVTILQASRHGRKLRRGALRGNRFRIVVRKMRGDLGQFDERLKQIAAAGVPNYFGPQRFGFDGRNVERGTRWLDRGGRLVRNKKSIYLSAVRSFLFNQVLSSRVKLRNWNRITDGEVAQLDGSRSLFPCNMPDENLVRRCEEFDIHPTGPLPGKGGLQAENDAAVLESAALSDHESLINALANAGVEAGRRSLRLLPGGMKWEFGDEQVVLEFELPPGGYATAVLRELVSTG